MLHSHRPNKLSFSLTGFKE